MDVLALVITLQRHTRRKAKLCEQVVWASFPYISRPMDLVVDLSGSGGVGVHTRGGGSTKRAVSSGGAPCIEL